MFKTYRKYLNQKLMCTFLIIFLIQYTVPPGPTVTDPKFILLGPDNSLNHLTTDDVYEKLIDIKDFAFLLNPRPCDEYPEGLLLVVLVSSKPSNYRNRMVIRNTWGRSTDSTKVLFLLGEQALDSSTSSFHDTFKENAIYGDVILGNFIDAYRNMTYKHVMGLKWIAHHCPKAKYVFKTDDDVVVNITLLRWFLARQLSPWGARGLITCHVWKHVKVEREDSKWEVTFEEYSERYYPNYCAGWTIIYSQDVVHKLLKIAQSIPSYWIDDVHLTGTCAQMSGITLTPLNELVIPKYHFSLLPRRTKSLFLGPTNKSPDEMTNIWNAMLKNKFQN